MSPTSAYPSDGVAKASHLLLAVSDVSKYIISVHTRSLFHVDKVYISSSVTFFFNGIFITSLLSLPRLAMQVASPT